MLRNGGFGVGLIVGWALPLAGQGQWTVLAGGGARFGADVAEPQISVRGIFALN